MLRINNLNDKPIEKVGYEVELPKKVVKDKISQEDKMRKNKQGNDVIAPNWSLRKNKTFRCSLTLILQSKQTRCKRKYMQKRLLLCSHYHIEKTTQHIICKIHKVVSNPGAQGSFIQ